MNARTFTHDVDGCWYGRHALRKAGGDNVQRDVLHVIPPRYRIARGINPTHFDPDYIGSHRWSDESTRWIRVDGSLARWAYGQTEIVMVDERSGVAR